ncbi:transposase [Lentzea guizhouensis]|uniref:transposase n=1 Tax=Lentzea guizhouensis TaxID=1586287 RepID=UPI0026AE5083
MNVPVKRAFRYRFHPTEVQAAELARTFGCVRKVYNLALQARAEAWTRRGERVGYDVTSALLTEWKRTDELAFLREVSSSVPLQQALRHLQAAFAHFFAKRARYPRYKSRKKSRARPASESPGCTPGQLIDDPTSCTRSPLGSCVRTVRMVWCCSGPWPDPRDQ